MVEEREKRERERLGCRQQAEHGPTAVDGDKEGSSEQYSNVSGAFIILIRPCNTVTTHNNTFLRASVYHVLV